MELIIVAIFLSLIVILIAGYPVAFTLSGAALFFAVVGIITGNFEPSFLEAIPNRLFTIMRNEVLMAVPLFIFMGAVLEKSGIAEDLLESMGLLFGPIRGGLAISVTIVGMFMAASTGIVGATVLTMGLLALPTMLSRGYHPSVAAGSICASGTLGQVIPPSIVLVLLGDVISSSYQKSQLEQGNYSPDAVSVGDLFIGALFPGLLLVLLYIIYLGVLAIFWPKGLPCIPKKERERIRLEANMPLIFKIALSLIAPMALIILVLGSILAGFATPTEAAAVGGMGGLFITLIKGKLNWKLIVQACYTTAFQTSMVFLILVGASFFSLIFRGFGGDTVVRDLLMSISSDPATTFIVVMLLIFALGFFIDFIEIIFVVIPIIGPPLMSMGFDPIWLGVMIGVNLQTSFLTPPFGFSLFYLRGVAPASFKTKHIYLGVIPFIIIQLVVLVILFKFQGIVTWLPNYFYG